MLRGATMVKEKICDCCNVKTKTRLDDLHEIGWSAFQIPVGKGKVYCFCPNCQDCMRKKMVEQLHAPRKTQGVQK